MDNEAGRAVRIRPTLRRPMKPGAAVLAAMLCLLAMAGVVGQMFRPVSASRSPC